MSFHDFRVTGFIKPGQHGLVIVDVLEEGDWDEFEGTLPLTRLWVRQTRVMADSHREWREHEEAIDRARGRVLVNGLGLGCYVKAILAKPEVKSVEVVEVNEDVIAMIGPYYTSDPRVRIYHADALDETTAYRWPRGTRWDVVWHDIWPSTNVEDLVQHGRLMRAYAGRCGWQGCWIHDELVQRRDGSRT